MKKYEEKMFNWLTVLQDVQAWHWYLLGFWWGLREILIMMEVEAGTGASHGERKNKRERERGRRCHTLLNGQLLHQFRMRTHSLQGGWYQIIDEGSTPMTQIPLTKHRFQC